MFECKVCGLLSLGGSSCPACGSQLRKDLSQTLLAEEGLPTEVPGLDEAAESWYELEGIEPPKEPEESPSSTSGIGESLPFGFQGESNVVSSRLPFGIGSFAEGIPFESGSGVPIEITAFPPTSISTLGPQSEPPAPAPTSEVVFSEPVSIPEPMVELPLPSEENTVVAQIQQPVAVIQEQQEQVAPQPVRLDSARLITTVENDASSPDVPDYWKIDAQIPNYEEIYDQNEQIVEVTYDSLDEDVMVYDHENDSPAAVFYSPLEATPVANVGATISLILHPIKAMSVDIKNHPELSEFMQVGFDSLQQRSWIQAARSFQKIAAKMPTDPYVFNNYGISLLQRALDLKESDDDHQKSMADAQFESAILALREAAKNAPTEGDILLNLAHALIKSGRSEKALGIMNVHNLRNPDSASGLNTAGVAMFHLGQLSQAMDTFRKASNDPIAQGNLSQFTKTN